MDFELTEEQDLLQRQVGRLLVDNYGFRQRELYRTSSSGWSADMWRRFAELGLLGLPFDEADGGVGGGAVETMIVMEALGEALALEPYFATVILAGTFLRLGAHQALRRELVPRIADGSLIMAFAQAEPNSRYDLEQIETWATRDGLGWRINGVKDRVQHGDCGNLIIVTARVAGGYRDLKGIGVFLVDAGSKGVSRRAQVLQDGQRAAQITFNNVYVPPEAIFGEPEDGLPLVRHVIDQAIAALAAEAVGVMSKMLRLTTDYLKVRRQFGVPIGSFQVLQHRAADMFVATEQSRSISYYAAMMAASGECLERAKAMHSVKAKIGLGGALVGQSAIQMHGGMGMVQENAVGHYFKRMTMIDLTFGDRLYHLKKLAELGGLFEDDRASPTSNAVDTINSPTAPRSYDC